MNTPPTEPEAKPPEAPAALTLEDLKDVEGLSADDPSTKTFVDLLNDPALSAKDRATKLLGLQRDVLKAVSEKSEADFIAMQETWQKETVADPEFANGKLQPALGGISKLLDKYGTAETRAAFDFTGAGNNPHIVKFLHNMSKILNEPQVDPIKPQPAAPARDAASLLYPNQGK